MTDVRASGCDTELSIRNLHRPRASSLLWEAWAMLRTQRTVSIVTAAITAIMIVTIMMTTGRTAAAERDVLGSIDNPATRTFTVSIQESEGVSSEIISQLRSFENAQWVSGFGPVQDVRVASFPGGEPIGLRFGWGDIIPAAEIFTGADTPLWLSDEALRRAGFSAPAGGFVSDGGATFSIVGAVEVPHFAEGLEPLVVARSPEPQTVTQIVVLADSAQNVAPLSREVVRVLGVTDPAKVEVSTSRTLVDLQAIVSGQFGEFGRELILIVIVVAALMVGTILSGLVLLRRRDFGRRRALGASRGTIIFLVLAQLLMLAVIGIVAGGTISLGVLAVQGSPVPSVKFIVALAIVTLATVGLAGAVPAGVAASRDPLTELRVP